MTLLEVRDLTKTFHRRSGWRRRVGDVQNAVDDVSFDLAPGETLAIVGESGAGKSTTGRLVLRLIEPTSGSIRFEGQDVATLGKSDLRRWRRHAQMIFQDPYTSFDPRCTIGQSIGEPLGVHFDARPQDQRRQSIELLERVGMGASHLSRYPAELSGGQLQRAAIARALTVRPSLIVCDEPVAALDVSIRAQVINLLADLQAELGVSYLFISHDLSLVEVFAHRVAVMQAGKIVDLTSAAELRDPGRHEYTRELLDAVPQVPTGEPSTELSTRAL